MPDVGTYELDMNDIGMKSNKQLLEFELEFSQKPPFNVSAPRFQSLKQSKSSKQKLDVIEEDKEQGIHSINKYKIPFKGKEVPIGGKGNRFSEENSKKIAPGPAQYKVENEWNKKSYNILFAEN